MYVICYHTAPWNLPLFACLRIRLSISKTMNVAAIDMLTLNTPPLTQFISVPRDLSQLSCEAFSAGLVEGVLDGLELVSPIYAHATPA